MKASELKYFSNFREGLNKEKLGNSNFRHFTHSPHESWMEKILWNLPIFPLSPIPYPPSQLTLARAGCVSHSGLQLSGMETDSEADEEREPSVSCNCQT